MIYFSSLAFIVLSYLVGAIPVSFLLCKKLKNIDIRFVGSKNVGATNAARVLGKKWFFIITAIDVFKGFLPVYLSKIFLQYKMIYPATVISIIIGLVTILGHIYPIYLNFKGGKGVAVSTGIFLAFDYRLVLVGFILFVITVGITKYISAGSVTASISLPFSYYFFNRDEIDKTFLIFTIFISIYVIYKHKGNIIRIIQGRERKWGEKI